MNEKSADNKRILKNSSILLFRMLVMMFITFYSSRILLKELGISDYGLYGVIGGIVAMFGSLRSVFASSIQRFLNFEMGKGRTEELNKVFSMGVIIHIILAFCFFILAELIGLWFLNYKLVIDPSRLVAANWVFQFSILTAIITILTIPYDAVIIANEKMKAFAFISLLDAILKFGVVLSLTLSSKDKLVFYSFLILIVSIVIRMISWLFCKRNFIESRFRYVWDKTLFRDLGRFAGWNFLGNTAQTLSNEGLNLVLNIFAGTPINAARSIAYQVRSVAMQFLNNILLAVNPHMIKLYSKKDEVSFLQMLFFISKMSYFLIFLITIPLFFFTEDLLEVWLLDIPPFTVMFVKLILGYLLVRSFHSPIDTLFKASGEIKSYQIVDSVTLFLTLPISYLLLKNNYAVYSVFLIMIFVEILNLLSILYLAYRMGKLDIMKYLNKVFLPCVSVSCVCIPICYILYYDFLFQSQNTVILLCVMTFVNLIGIAVLGFNKKEKKYLYQKLELVTKVFK